MPTVAVFLTTAKDYVRLSCFSSGTEAGKSDIVFGRGEKHCSSVCYCSEFSRQLILKLASDVQDWRALWTLESKAVILNQKPIIWFPELLF